MTKDSLTDKATNTEALLPCPFCGKKAYVAENSTSHAIYPSLTEWWVAGCEKCGIHFRGGSQKDLAISFWNTRQPPASNAPTYLDGELLKFDLQERSTRDNEGHYISIMCNGSELIKVWNPDKKRRNILLYIFDLLSRSTAAPASNAPIGIITGIKQVSDIPIIASNAEVVKLLTGIIDIADAPEANFNRNEQISNMARDAIAALTALRDDPDICDCSFCKRKRGEI